MPVALAAALIEAATQAAQSVIQGMPAQSAVEQFIAGVNAYNQAVADWKAAEKAIPAPDSPPAV